MFCYKQTKSRTSIMSTLSSTKRRRFMASGSTEVQNAKAKLADVTEKLGREIRVFTTSISSSASAEISSEEEPDDLEFTAEDYFRVLSIKKQDTVLKTRKLREAEEAARRQRMTKAVIRVRFPDNYTLEVKFQPSETLQSLYDLLMKVVARPDLSFYIYTTPPKKQIKDMSQDFYSAGFVPGAVVYFSYDLPKGDESASVNSGPFLGDDICSLNDVNLILEAMESAQGGPVVAAQVLNVQKTKPAEKKGVKPKWFKG